MFQLSYGTARVLDSGSDCMAPIRNRIRLYFDADQIQIRILFQVLHVLDNRKIFYLIHSSSSLFYLAQNF